MPLHKKIALHRCAKICTIKAGCLSFSYKVRVIDTVHFDDHGE